MDDPTEDFLKNGIIVLLFDPHVILRYTVTWLMMDLSKSTYTAHAFRKGYFCVSHTCKCPMYTADRRCMWLRLVFKTTPIRSAEFISLGTES